MAKTTATVKELAGMLNVDYLAASGLMRVLESKGLAVKQDETKRENGKDKGRGSYVFELDTEFVINLNTGTITALVDDTEEIVSEPTPLDTPVQSEHAAVTADSEDGTFSLTTVGE